MAAHKYYTPIIDILALFGQKNVKEFVWKQNIYLIFWRDSPFYTICEAYFWFMASKIFFSNSIPFTLFLFSGKNSPVRFLYFWWRSWARNSRCTRGTFSAEVWQKIFSKEERGRFRLFYKIQNQKSIKKNWLKPKKREQYL